MQASLTHTIDGRPVEAVEFFDVINPATASVFAQAPEASRAQLDLAVEVARRAFERWRAVPTASRRKILSGFAAAIRAETQILAPLLTREQGKPLAAAVREIESTAARIEGLLAFELTPETLRDDERGRVVLDYQPMGVVGAIAPWNSPLLLATQIAAQALVTGNSVVVKPSPFTPLATLRLGEIAARTLPPGLFNTLSGGNELGRWMTEHAGIDKIGFVGSVATGKRVLASAAASNLKRVSLELGGNDAAIVLADADVDSIAPKLFSGAFANSGQRCMAIKRVLVHESLIDRLGAALAQLAKQAKVGDGFEPGVELGPVQNRPQFERVLGLIDDALSRGGRALAGGAALNRAGYFIAPTIVTGVAEGTPLVDEEQFGPVLPLLTFTHVDEAVARANATRFGLGASVWSGDPERAADIAHRLEAGTVWINSHGGSLPEIPFGGCKESGIGRGMGLMGLKSYVEPRVSYLP
ncbi:aldehyde dehydrogenase family protein [Steroidobacter flavus]|uniref:Aldehyde dehydrogenase family protein n=1 Tax=Steroidobacter flavus TaxID=1842136 RepID=A0ABV8SW59_9GAMM